MQQKLNAISRSISSWNAVQLIALGLLGGLGLGIIARLWMRWITTNPEFTWSGTLGIVLGFTFFGTAHSLFYIIRRRTQSWRKAAIFRIVAIFFTLPIFGAAGAVMFPTVLLGGLSLWRTTWFRWIRIIIGLLSAAWAGKVAYAFIIKEFGWSLESIAQILLFAAIYLVIINITKLTMEKPVPNLRLSKASAH